MVGENYSACHSHSLLVLFQFFLDYSFIYIRYLSVWILWALVLTEPNFQKDYIKWSYYWSSSTTIRSWLSRLRRQRQVSIKYSLHLVLVKDARQESLLVWYLHLIKRPVATQEHSFFFAPSSTCGMEGWQARVTMHKGHLDINWNSQNTGTISIF